MKTYAITFTLTTTSAEPEVEHLAAELAREHLRDCERLWLSGVEPAPRERPPAGG